MFTYCESQWSNELASISLNYTRFTTPSPEEQAELLSRLDIARENGDDKTAMEVTAELVQRNWKIIMSVMKNFYSYFDSTVNPSDMFAEGRLGLLKAVRLYERKPNVIFFTFAALLIKQAVISYIDTNSIRPRSSIKEMNDILKARTDLHVRLGREPDIEELAAETGFSTKVVASRLFENNIKIISFEEKTGRSLHDDDSKPQTYWDVVCNDSELTEEESRTDFEGLYTLMRDTLDMTEQRVLHLRHGLRGRKPLTLLETGRVLGLAGQDGTIAEKVRRLEQKAIEKLQAAHRREVA